MSEKTKKGIATSVLVSDLEQQALDALIGGEWKKYGRVAMAALSALPWVGSVISAAATLSAENDQGRTNHILFLWVKEHEEKIKSLQLALNQIFLRFDSFGERIKERIESEDFISIMRKAFQNFDRAETSEKKEMLRKLITNAGGSNTTQDDLTRMFIEWIDRYHEFHFKVIGEIYRNSGITRRRIWTNIRGVIPVDSSAEADLFKLLIDELSQGRVIRQKRETDSTGRFLRSSGFRKVSSGDTLATPFDDIKPYVLTDLGSQFVRYVMTELTPQIESS